MLMLVLMPFQLIRPNLNFKLVLEKKSLNEETGKHNKI